MRRVPRSIAFVFLEVSWARTPRCNELLTSDATSPSAADVSATADVSAAEDVSITAEELWTTDAVAAPGRGCSPPVVICPPGRAARSAAALAAPPCCIPSLASPPISKDSSWLALLPASCCGGDRDEPLDTGWMACMLAFLAGTAYTLLANSNANVAARFACLMMIGMYACPIVGPAR